MKKYRKTLTVTIILVVALIIFASFFGAYIINKDGEKVGLLPDLNLGMEFGDTRVITASVDQGTTTIIYDKEGNIVEPEEGKEYKEEDGYTTVEQPINAASLKKLSNYKKAKEIIEKRLKGNNISEYSIDLNQLTGKMRIEIAENSKAEEIQKIIQNSGSFFLLDGETLETVFDSTYLEKAEVMYSQGDVETGVFLQLSFNEEGTKKLEELGKIYVETTEEKTNESGEVETVTNSKTVWVFLNDNFLGTTVLSNIVYNNKVMLTFNVTSDVAELETAIKDAEYEAVLLNAGTLPLAYEYSNEVQKTTLNKEAIIQFFTAIGIVFVIAYVYLVVKYKARGFISVYFQIGFLAVLIIVLRLTNVVLTMEGIAGIIISMILEYIFTYIVLRCMERGIDGMYKEANLEFFLNTLPAYIISIIFTFAPKANINSFGMTLFWGIIIIYVYNFIFSKFVFENLKGRSE